MTPHDGGAATPRTVSLVITTYERPDALAAVLATVGAQRVQPDEVLVADDGSGEPTRDVISAFAARSATPVLHVRQPHDGFRLARLRNLAIARARGAYVLVIDGDMLLHPSFVADHRRTARPGYWTQGVRILVDDDATRRALAATTTCFGPFSRGLGGLRRMHAVHSPVLSPLLRSIGNSLIAIKGCNQAFWREDLVAVNGYNEAIEGWGPEDKELVARLGRRGIRRQSLLFGGIAYHLHHPPANRERRARNEAIYAEILASNVTRCERGLDSHAG